MGALFSGPSPGDLTIEPLVTPNDSAKAGHQRQPQSPLPSSPLVKPSIPHSPAAQAQASVDHKDVKQSLQLRPTAERRSRAASGSGTQATAPKRTRSRQAKGAEDNVQPRKKRKTNFGASQNSQTEEEAVAEALQKLEKDERERHEAGCPRGSLRPMDASALPASYAEFPRMWKSVPVVARNEFLVPVRRACVKFEHAYAAANRTTAAAALHEFMAIPRLYLKRKRAGKHKHKAAANELRRSIAMRAVEVYPSATSEEKSVSAQSLSSTMTIAKSDSKIEGKGNDKDEKQVPNTQQQVMTEEETKLEQTKREVAQVRRAEETIREGLPHAVQHAVKALVGTAFGVAALDKNVLEECQKLHPTASATARSVVDVKPPAAVFDGSAGVAVMADELVGVISRKVANGSAAGPSGWTGELLAIAANDEQAMPGLTAMVAALANDWFAGHAEEPAVAQLMLASRLVLITKPNTKSGIRPIAMGEALFKAAAIYCKSKITDKGTEQLWSKNGIQYGVSISGGCDTAVLKVQALLDADPLAVAVFADVSNAFNTRQRAAIAEQLYNEPITKPIWRMFQFAYARCESPLIVYGRGGRCEHVQPSAEGVRQGDPLASLLFAVSMDQLYANARAAVPPGAVECVAVLDDATFVGRPEHATRAMEAFMGVCEKEGLKINKGKCKVLMPQPKVNTGEVQKMREAVERWSERSGVQVMEGQFAPTLGSVVGRDESGMKQWTMEQVKRHHQFFEMVPKLSKQCGLAVLRVAGTPRLNHIVRTLPTRVTAQASLAFDNAIVECFRRVAGLSADEVKPTVRTQAQLPLRLGGNGLRSYEQTHAAAYVAAVATAASHLPVALLRERTSTKPTDTTA